MTETLQADEPMVEPVTPEAEPQPTEQVSNTSVANQETENPRPKKRLSNTQWVIIFAVITVCCWGAIGLGALSAGAFAAPTIVAAQQATRNYAITQTQQVYASDTASAQQVTATYAHQLLATSTAEAGLVAAADDWALIHSEPFQNNDANWNTGDVKRPDSSSLIEIADDQYHWEIETPDGFWIPVSFESGTFEDFYAAVDTMPISGSEDMNYGIIFRVNDDGLYFFGLTQTGETLFGVNYNGNWITSLTLEPVSDILNANSNRLAVMAQGSHFTFFVNGHYVGETDDDRLPEGRLGLALGQVQGDTKVMFNFDNFEVKAPAFDPSQALAAQTAIALVDGYTKGRIMFFDNFRNNQSGWYVGEDDDEGYYNSTFAIEDDVFKFSLEALDGFVRYVMVPRVDAQSDFYYKLDVRNVNGSDHVYYGMLFRRLDVDNYYLFAINDNRQAEVWLYYEAEWQMVLEEGAVSAIHPGEVNTLAVLAEGSYLAFFINDQFIGDSENSPLAEGRFGIVVDVQEAGDTAELEFDNLELRLSNDAPLFDPLPTSTPFAVLMPFELSGRIAYQAGGRLYLMNANGGNVRLIDFYHEDGEPFRDVYSLEFSPDGKRIIFEERGALYMIESPRFDLVALDVPVNKVSDPSWSPDGQQVVVVASEDVAAPQSDLYILTLEDNELTRLTDTRAIEVDPIWSPDGKQIAFVEIENGDYQIKVINADGSGLRTLSDGLADDRDPSWSPDGEWIAFASRRGGRSEVFIVRPDGSELTQLTDNPANDFGPSWSPDGQLLAFLSDRDGVVEIYVMQADGSQPYRITLNSLGEFDLDWAP